MADTKFLHPVMGRRTFLGGTLAAGAMAALAGCGGEGAEGGSKVINYYISEPAYIDPYNAQENQGTSVVFTLFDTLTSWNWDTNEVDPLCAEELPEVSDDGLVYTFKLRKGMKFHNGDPVDAASFKRGWERAVDPKMKTPGEVGYHLAPVAGYEAFAKGEADEITGLVAVDDLTFQVTLSAPMYDFMAVCAHPALSPVPQTAVDDPESFLENPIGNGAFKMVEPWKHNQYIQVEKFDDYYGDAPAIDGVYFSIQKSPDTAFTEFEAGNIDFVHIPSGRIKDCQDKYGTSEDGYTVTPGKQVLLGTEASVYYMICGPNDPVLADVNVRHALSLAIDRESMCETLFEGSREPATSIMPTMIDPDGVEQNTWKYCAYDPEQAASILDAAGWVAGEDGVRSKGGQKLTVTLNYNGDGGHEDIMSAIQADLEKVGFEVAQDTLEWAAYLNKLSDKNFSLARLGWTADYPTMDNFLYPNFFSSADNNYEEYNNPEMDAAMLAARQIEDEQERRAACRAICAKIGEDMPVIPIVFYAHADIGSERLASFMYDAQTKPYFGRAELA